MIKFNPLVNYNKFIHILIITLPICYIIGSFSLNVVIIIFSLIFFFLILNRKIDFDLKFYFFFIFFFIFILVNTLLSDFSTYSFYKFTSYLRFSFFTFSLIFFLFYCSNKQLKIITFFFTSIILFVIIDTFIQFLFNEDLFGFKVDYNKAYGRLSGPFGDEFIVGSYLLVFGFINYFLVKKIFINNIYIDIFYLTLLPIIIFLTGERSAFLSCLIFLFLLLILNRKERIKIFLCIFIVFISIFIITKNFQPLKDRYSLTVIAQTYLDLEESTNYFQKENEKNEKKENLTIKDDLINKKNLILSTLWFKHFNGAIEIFKNNYYFGSGFKTYRYACIKIDDKKSKNVVCTTHPHNIYFELLSDTGIIGFFIFLIFLFKICFDFFRNKLFYKFQSNIIFSLMLSFLFPLKPHGSFFTTNYAFLFWLILSFLLYEFYFHNQNKK